MIRLIVMLVVFLAIGADATMAQDKYPSRPVKVIVPYAPGGATDIVARIVGDEFQKITGQGFVVLNKPGAFGMLAIDDMVKSAPDGYTLMIGNVSTNAITPIIYAKKMNPDYDKSVVAVTNLVDVPAFLLVGTANDFAVKSVPELIAYAKTEPRQGPLRHRRCRVLPALRHGVFCQACRQSRSGRPSQQKRRSGRDSGHVARRRSDRIPERSLDRGTSAGWRVPSVGGGQSRAAEGIPRHTDDE